LNGLPSGHPPAVHQSFGSAYGRTRTARATFTAPKHKRLTPSSGMVADVYVGGDSEMIS